MLAKAKTPPVIDGKLTDGEWSQAPACTAFVQAFEDRLSHLQSIALVTYDDTHLYVAIRNYRGAQHSLLKAQGRRADDERIVSDFSNEIWFCPPSAPQRLYQTLFNVYPGVFDALQIPSLGYTAKSWKGNWEIASSETLNDWVIEARAPNKSFGVDKIKDGAVWRALFTTDIFTDKDKFRAWAPGGGFADIDRQGVLRFADNSAVVQFGNVESIFTGKVRFPVGITGPLSGSEDLTVEARFGPELVAKDGDLVVRQSASVADGARKDIGIEADLTARELPLDKAGNKTGFCELTGKTADGDILYHQVFPFVIDGFVRQPPEKILASPYKTAFGVQSDYAPLNKKLLLKIDRFYLPDRAEATTGTVRLLDPSSASSRRGGRT